MDTANIFEIKKMVNEGELTRVRTVLHTGFPGGHELVFSRPDIQVAYIDPQSNGQHAHLHERMNLDKARAIVSRTGLSMD